MAPSVSEIHNFATWGSSPRSAKVRGFLVEGIAPEDIIGDAAYALGLPKRGDPHPYPNVFAQCEDTQVVEVISSSPQSDTSAGYAAVVRAVYYPPNLLGLRTRISLSSYDRTERGTLRMYGGSGTFTDPYKLLDDRYEYSRVRTTIVDRTLSAITADEVHKWKARNAGLRYMVSGIPCRLESVSWSADGSGRLLIETRYFTTGPMPEVPAGAVSGSTIAYPKLDSLEEHTESATAGNVTIGVRPATFWPAGSPRPWS